MGISTGWRKPAVALAALGLLAACGDSGDEATRATTASTASTAAVADEPEVLTVTAVDYGFEGLPSTIEAGTKISLVNASDDELHELIAVRLPDGEERSVEELLALPEEELEPLFPGLTDVIVALPGETDAPGAVEGDGVLDEPGRYALFCFIPIGADPQAYLEAVGSGEEPGADGAPHHTAGMFAEVVVR